MNGFQLVLKQGTASLATSLTLLSVVLGVLGHAS